MVILKIARIFAILNNGQGTVSCIVLYFSSLSETTIILFSFNYRLKCKKRFFSLKIQQRERINKSKSHKKKKKITKSKQTLNLIFQKRKLSYNIFSLLHNFDRGIVVRTYLLWSWELMIQYCNHSSNLSAFCCSIME